MKRKILRIASGHAGIDGAGVALKNVMGRSTMYDADPLLLLDAFDSSDPAEYEKGFPMHPHRGIETISYVVEGTMVHKDSLGNEDAVSDGGVQWMTAGSGIFHEEMMPAVKRLYGVQLWLNLAKKDKFAPPAYKAIDSAEIEDIPFDGGHLRLLAGEYDGHTGFQSPYQPVNYYDVHIEPGRKFTTKVDSDAAITVFALRGAVQIGGETLPHFEAAILTEGDKLVLENPGGEEISVLVFQSQKIGEPIAWRPGPIVMNTEEELDTAYDEVRNGGFIKEKIHMEK